ncbi:MAG: vacuolar ATPase assembly integral membrane protein vma21 [Peltula sp. TS41687]|nr:MAG: vacuolar ATPase assembly integral membrane protein vma21 [Peltula sp. TS41687]
MTTRRPITHEKDINLSSSPSSLYSAGPRTVSSPPSSKSDISPAVPASVIIKLLAFTFAMIGGPIGTYYLSLHTFFKGNSTFAGASAAIMANVVLVAYIAVAMREDQSERRGGPGKEGKKSR